ncbi:uncharacterized protein LOC107046756 [Diachasma alloeum]|uniref:uncharacterized protein LOC107046756 n=1 Tax=Diachasma alloeum TaxID=454923 RepID=UPI00073824DF|nr:uncharacterized protein LOC107046756 [Diachasma alloeum]
MLLILKRKKADGAPQLHKAIAGLLGEDAKVLSKAPQEEFEIKDLDEITTKEEVLEALQVAAGDEYTIDSGAVKSIRKAFRGTQTASVTLAATAAKKIVGEHGKIKIGWVICRMIRVERPVKCFRCWHYGHLATQCKSEADRSKLCTRCTEPGHKIAECKKEPLCALCTERGNAVDSAHVAGSGKCPVLKEALQKLNNKRRQ